MADFQKMYLVLFNAITDALHELEQDRLTAAARLLRQAQQAGEELYLRGEEDK